MLTERHKTQLLLRPSNHRKCKQNQAIPVPVRPNQNINANEDEQQLDPSEGLGATPNTFECSQAEEQWHPTPSGSINGFSKRTSHKRKASKRPKNYFSSKPLSMVAAVSAKKPEVLTHLPSNFQPNTFNNWSDGLRITQNEFLRGGNLDVAKTHDASIFQTLRPDNALHTLCGNGAMQPPSSNKKGTAKESIQQQQHIVTSLNNNLHNRLPMINEMVQSRYRVLQILGKGSFGKVFKCFDHLDNRYVAIKVIISDHVSSINQSLVEISILRELNLHDVGGTHIVRLIDEFMWNHHKCLVFELLAMNLYETIQMTRGVGIDLDTIREVASKLLRTLTLLHDQNIIHCDLKPENIMVSGDCEGYVKMVDFGSSCRVGAQIYSYIQSRFYRAPEVIMELSYSTPIDVWSLGCVLAEMSTCEPLFYGRNEVDQMGHIVQYLGVPPSSMICLSPKAPKFFGVNCCGEYEFIPSPGLPFSGPFSKSLVQYLTKNKVLGVPDGLLFRGRHGIDDSFENFIFSMLNYDPSVRANPYDLMLHPFVFSLISTQLNLPPDMIGLTPTLLHGLIRERRDQYGNRGSESDWMPSHTQRLMPPPINCNSSYRLVMCPPPPPAAAAILPHEPIGNNYDPQLPLTMYQQQPVPTTTDTQQPTGSTILTDYFFDLLSTNNSILPPGNLLQNSFIIPDNKIPTLCNNEPVKSLNSSSTVTDITQPAFNMNNCRIYDQFLPPQDDLFPVTHPHFIPSNNSHLHTGPLAHTFFPYNAPPKRIDGIRR